MAQFLNVLSEIIYILSGLVSLSTAIRALKNKKAPYGTALFWFLLAVIFIGGKKLPPLMVGVFIVIFALLTLTKQVQIGEFKAISVAETKANAAKLGNKIFIPSLILAFVAMGLVMIKIPTSEGAVAVPGAVAIGLSAIIALIVGERIAKPSHHQINEDTNKLLMQIGAASLLPQLLGTLGTIFNKAGVGEVIANLLSGIVPENNMVIGVIIYCLGMMIFTMIMGNAFAAFAVITAGIGAPFLLAQGANPVMIGALGMTAGYCGTLMTPMAANFNIVPSALLDMKNKYGVIKAQLPVAIVLLLAHMALMILFAI